MEASVAFEMTDIPGCHFWPMTWPFGGGERTRTVDLYIANGTVEPPWPGISRGFPGHFGRRGAPKGKEVHGWAAVESC